MCMGDLGNITRMRLDLPMCVCSTTLENLNLKHTSMGATGADHNTFLDLETVGIQDQ